jgi:hypothetical protein
MKLRGTHAGRNDFRFSGELVPVVTAQGHGLYLRRMACRQAGRNSMFCIWITKTSRDWHALNRERRGEWLPLARAAGRQVRSCRTPMKFRRVAARFTTEIYARFAAHNSASRYQRARGGGLACARISR